LGIDIRKTIGMRLLPRSRRGTWLLAEAVSDVSLSYGAIEIFAALSI
jgi:hypothetical protein